MFPIRSFLYNLTLNNSNHILSALQVMRKKSQTVYCAPKHWINFKVTSCILCPYFLSIQFKYGAGAPSGNFRKISSSETHAGADSGDEGKSKRAENMARRKVKNCEKSSRGQCLTRPVPNGRSRSGFWLVPENCVWNWSGKTLSPGALLAVLYFSSCHILPPV